MTLGFFKGRLLTSGAEGAYAHSWERWDGPPVPGERVHTAGFASTSRSLCAARGAADARFRDARIRVPERVKAEWDLSGAAGVERGVKEKQAGGLSLQRPPSLARLPSVLYVQFAAKATRGRGT